jgi:hypothetical protein
MPGRGNLLAVASIDNKATLVVAEMYGGLHCAAKAGLLGAGTEFVFAVRCMAGAADPGIKRQAGPFLGSPFATRIEGGRSW